jgi:hypothetical protein
MKKYLKGFFTGLLVATLLMNVALGETVKKTIEVVYNSVNLTVNGKKVNADNILYNGTTYVPLRAISEMLGKEVGWDQATSTASINDKNVGKPKKEEPEVSTKIGAPSVYNGIGDNGELYPFVKFGFKMNSANGIELNWIAQNLTGRTINYYTVNVAMYNAVGDPALDEIKGTNKLKVGYVGPVAPNDPLLVSSLIGYSGVCNKIVIESIEIEYSDRTKETIPYGYSTSLRTVK